MEFEQSPTEDFSGYNLVLPSVSVGNVGQLAMDALLTNLSPPPTSLGQVHHPSLIPLVGPDPLRTSSSSITTALQLYHHPPSRLLLLQLRSGLVPGGSRQFLSDLLHWCKTAGVARVVNLSSCHAHERTDCQMTGDSQLRYLVTGAGEEEEMGLPQTWRKMEQRERFPGLARSETPDSLFLPGAGLSKRLYLTCAEAGLTCLVLLLFCDEGDNTRDGMDMANHVNQWLGVVKEGRCARLPASWKHLFGNETPRELF